MGDTLTHLPDLASLDSLFASVAAALLPGGLFVARFRDYVFTPLQGDRRFILMHGDENRILGCFLDYSDKTVKVHDVLHERAAGICKLRLGSYAKLRLAPGRVARALASHGFSVGDEAGRGGMVGVVTRP